MGKWDAMKSEELKRKTFPSENKFLLRINIIKRLIIN